MDNQDDQSMLPIEVVAAVIRDAEGKILIAQRPSDKHQGGKWEFPGGKVEKGESRRSALLRELNEELDIEIGHSTRLISVYHEYEDKAIYLDVYEVSQWSGVATGKEGQAIRWVTVDELEEFEFPAANSSIIQAVKLPKQVKRLKYLADLEVFKAMFLSEIELGHRLFLLSNDNNQAVTDSEGVNWLLDTAAENQVVVLFEFSPTLVRNDYGLHLSSAELLKINEKPSALIVSASCSGPGELFKAQSLRLDLIIVGPVLAELAEGEKPLGWPIFQSLTGRVNMPIYAAGGVSVKDMELAREYGAQGVVS